MLRSRHLIGSPYEKNYADLYTDYLLSTFGAATATGFTSSTLPARKWLIPLETYIKPQTTKRAWRGLMGSGVKSRPQKVTSVRV